LDRNEYARQVFEEFNIDHPTEKGRSFLGDMDNELEKLHERVEEQGLDQFPSSEVEKLYKKVWSQYTDPTSRTDKGMSAWLEQEFADMENLGEELKKDHAEGERLFKQLESGSTGIQDAIDVQEGDQSEPLEDAPQVGEAEAGEAPVE
jgi:hypothetical protein